MIEEKTKEVPQLLSSLADETDKLIKNVESVLKVVSPAMRREEDIIADEAVNVSTQTDIGSSIFIQREKIIHANDILESIVRRIEI